MRNVQAKKNLGQHFLKDPEKAKSIVDSLSLADYNQVLEIGPGMGILTDFLFEKKNISTKIIDIDSESIVYLNDKYPLQRNNIIEGDFLQVNLENIFQGQFGIIGNFPYNISTQILFRILDNRSNIPEVTGMFQKEVAERIAGTPGGREYGILSVFMQTWYDVKIIMTLDQEDFNPPPKVKSAVLHFVRKTNDILTTDEKLFRRVVKTAFNQRRKTLRNSLSSMVSKEHSGSLPFAELRAEALSWKQFEQLTNAVDVILKSR